MDFERENQIDESSMSRLWRWNEDYNCAALTAFRLARDCNKGKLYTRNENIARNKSLQVKLQAEKYSITKVIGVYNDEESKKHTEISFFVVDKWKRSDEEFFNYIIKLGEEFEQDSVLLIPKGAIQGKSQAFLYGTNHCDNGYIKYHEKKPFLGGAKINYNSPFYTTFINGKPFAFVQPIKEVVYPGGGFGYLAMGLFVNEPWTTFLDRITEEDLREYDLLPKKTRPERLLDEINNYSSKNGEINGEQDNKGT
jgi:hypothetical protein